MNVSKTIKDETGNVCPRCSRSDSLRYRTLFKVTTSFEFEGELITDVFPELRHYECLNCGADFMMIEIEE
jgi:DNA-directed RNA polymerase subunit RPC12/RpoP